MRVLGIAPGFTDTEAAFTELASIAAGRSKDVPLTRDDLLARYLERIPPRRVATPHDMARVALFCVSDLAV